MNCARHPAREALATCRRCRKPFCPLCAKFVEGVPYCTPCGVDAVRSRVYRAAEALRATPPPAPDRLLAPYAKRIAFGALAVVLLAEANRRGLLDRGREAAAKAGEAVRVVGTASDPRIALARMELDALARGLTIAYLQDGSFPEDLSAFVAKYAKPPGDRRPGDDPWGVPYRLRVSGTAAEIASAGPDKRFGTEDDMTARAGGS